MKQQKMLAMANVNAMSTWLLFNENALQMKI